jgi:hypothetical protein
MYIPLGAPLHKDGSSMSSIIKIAAPFLFGKEFTDPMTLLTALGKYGAIVSVVERDSKWAILRNFGYYYLWFSMDSATCGHTVELW